MLHHSFTNTIVSLLCYYTKNIEKTQLFLHILFYSPRNDFVHKNKSPFSSTTFPFRIIRAFQGFYFPILSCYYTFFLCLTFYNKYISIKFLCTFRLVHILLLLYHLLYILLLILVRMFVLFVFFLPHDTQMFYPHILFDFAIFLLIN